jgi:ribosome-associated heat shock protein Hsp15
MLAAVAFASDRTRIDKWLWCVRLFKTRALATAACRAGSVLINDQPVKPAREVQAEEIITVRQGLVTRTVRVVAAPAARVAGRQVPAFCIELTPASEFEKARTQRVQQVLAREKGAGRPTKRDRRQLDQLLERE